MTVRRTSQCGTSPVPDPNSTANVTTSDVIGNKDDSHFGGSNAADSLAAKIKTLIEHIHEPSDCYPELAYGVNVVGGVGAWTLSAAFTTIIPENTVTDDFDIHFVNIESASASDEYLLMLYDGDDNEIGKVRFRADTGFFSGALPSIPIQTTLLPANTEVKAKLASSTGGDNVTISLHYHEY